MPTESLALEDLRSAAYEAFDSGRLLAAATHFEAVLQQQPKLASAHYMLGLAYKYLRNWSASLQCNLHALELHEEGDEASLWNAGIAATALGDWPEARRLWQACGISLPEGSGPIEADFGQVCIRLNAWDRGEVVYARRIDPVRARIENVPLPDSGYRYNDIVLHDGASTGSRAHDGQRYFVFNAMGRWQVSDFQTFVVFLSAENQEDIEQLTSARLPGIGHIEDWTGNLRYLCLRCSYGQPHSHDESPDAKALTKEWKPQRNLGIAAQSRASVDRLLENWRSAAPGRQVEAVEAPQHEPSEPRDGTVWWLGPESDEDAEA